jgi:hypothetical protein
LAHLHGYFREQHVVIEGLWPAQSVNLPSCDFHLWRALKQKAYHKNHHTHDKLEVNIQAEIAII